MWHFKTTSSEVLEVIGGGGGGGGIPSPLPTTLVREKGICSIMF